MRIVHNTTDKQHIPVTGLEQRSRCYIEVPGLYNAAAESRNWSASTLRRPTSCASVAPHSKSKWPSSRNQFLKSARSCGREAASTASVCWAARVCIFGTIPVIVGRDHSCGCFALLIALHSVCVVATRSALARPDKYRGSPIDAEDSHPPHRDTVQDGERHPPHT